MLVLPTVPEGARLLVVGQCPGTQEAKQGAPFVGPDGRQLRDWLRAVGIDPATVAFDNVHRDFNGDPVYKPKAKELKLGYEAVKQVIDVLRPDVVLLLGGPAAHMVFKGNMGQMHGRQEVIDGILYTATYHPGYYRNALRESLRAAVTAENEILAVLRTVAGVLKGERRPDPVANLPEGVYHDAVSFSDPSTLIAIDVETYGETAKIAGDPRKAEFVLCAWTPDSISVERPVIHPGAHLLVHNVPYDGVALGYWDARWEDTKMLAHMMGEDDTTLKGMGLRYLDHIMLTYPEAVRLNVLPEYCLDDAQTTMRLYPMLRDMIDPGPLRLYDELEVPLNALWTKMTIEGTFFLDHEALQRYHDELANEVNILLLDIEDALPRGRVVSRCKACHLKQQHKVKGQRCDDGKNHRWETTYLADEPVNIGSPKQLLDALQSLGIPVWSTRAEEVARILEEAETREDSDEAHRLNEEFDEAIDRAGQTYPVLRLLQRYRKANKILTTYVIPWLSIPEGTRFGCIWNPHGTWTMRVSSRGPNMQNIPGELHRFFHAGEGYVNLEFDHSQLELRLAAHVSRDPYMTAVYRDGLDGGDMHSAIVKRLNLSDRRLAKVFNFGVLYDTHDSGAGFDQNARKYGVKLSPKQIADAQREMRAAIPGYIKWRSETMHLRAVPGLFGMVHYIPRSHKQSHTENAAVNAPIQGGGALVTKFGMKATHESGYEVIRQVHDSVAVRVPIVYQREAEHDVARIMEQAIPEPLSVPLKVEVKQL